MLPKLLEQYLIWAEEYRHFREMGEEDKKTLNNTIRKLLKEYDIHHFVNSDLVKTENVEQFNRTLKSKMWGYFIAQNTLNRLI